MAIQISGTTVIDNSRNLTNIESVAGNGIATQAEAEAGTVNNQIMTPLRTSQALATRNPTVETLTTSGTYVKDLTLDQERSVLIELWGAGGSGGRRADSDGMAVGGGGGAYVRLLTQLKFLGTSEIYTIGSGGVARTTNGTGATGGATTFYGATANGGAGGSQAVWNNSNTSVSGASGGSAIRGISVSFDITFSGGSSTSLILINNPVNDPGTELIQGAAGGHARRAGTDTAGLGGVSTFGGNGGAGSTTGNASAGVVPGGGGGASCSLNSGAGANGQVRITIL